MLVRSLGSLFGSYFGLQDQELLSGILCCIVFPSALACLSQHEMDKNLPFAPPRTPRGALMEASWCSWLPGCAKKSFADLLAPLSGLSSALENDLGGNSWG